METVRRHLTPEFINRIDDVILFNRLTRENMDKIVHIQLRDVIHRLLDQEIHLNATEEAVKMLGDMGV